MTLRLPSYAWLALLPAVAALAFLVGRELRSDAADSFAYDLEAPGYVAAVPATGLSSGGFSGFGASGPLDGDAVIAGRITAVGGGQISVRTEGGDVTLRVQDGSVIRRIEAAPSAALRPGSTVVAHLASSGEVAALLVLATP